jgi:hypothetical protein
VPRETTGRRFPANATRREKFAAGAHDRQPKFTADNPGPRQAAAARNRHWANASDSRRPRQTSGAHDRRQQPTAEAHDKQQRRVTDRRRQRQKAEARARQQQPATDSGRQPLTAEARSRQPEPTTGESTPRQAQQAHDQQERRTTDPRSQRRQTAERPFVYGRFKSAAVCASRPREDTFGCAQTPERKRRGAVPQVHRSNRAPSMQMDTLGIEPRASRMLSGCDTTTPCALSGIFHEICDTQIVAQLRGKTSATARRGRRRGRTDGVDGKATGPRAPESV